MHSLDETNAELFSIRSGRASLPCTKLDSIINEGELIGSEGKMGKTFTAAVVLWNERRSERVNACMSLKNLQAFDLSAAFLPVLILRQYKYEVSQGKQTSKASRCCLDYIGAGYASSGRVV